MNQKELRERLWDPAWGEVEDYAFADDIEQLAGFEVGDDIVVTVENAGDPTNPTFYSAYEDDEGTVVGFAQPREGGGVFNLPKTGHNLYVSFEGDDPRIVDPADVEKI